MILIVGMVVDVIEVEGVKEVEGIVVQGQVEDGYIVCVYDFVIEIDGLLLCDQVGGVFDYFDQLQYVMVGVISQFWKIFGNYMVGQFWQCFVLFGVIEKFEMFKVYEVWCYVVYYGGGFNVFVIYWLW